MTVKPIHVRTAPAAVGRRLTAVVDRLDVALQFKSVDAAVLAQTLHAVDFAIHGPPGRDDDDYLPGISESEALALVRALLPFVAAARKRPGMEGPVA